MKKDHGEYWSMRMEVENNIANLIIEPAQRDFGVFWPKLLETAVALAMWYSKRDISIKITFLEEAVKK